MKNILLLLLTLFVFEVSKANVSVYPTVSNTYYFVEIDSLTNKDTISITLLTLIGEQTVIIKDTISTTKKFLTRINADSIPVGLYLVQVTVNNEITTRKVIKEHSYQTNISVITDLNNDSIFNNFVNVSIENLELNKPVSIEIFNRWGIITGNGFSDSLVNTQDFQFKYDLENTIDYTYFTYKITTKNKTVEGVLTKLEKVITGTSDLAKTNTNTFYPNPTTGLLNSSTNKFDKIEIYNSKGELINTISNKSNIDLSSYENGEYQIRMHSEKNISIQKIIKQ